MVISFKAFEKMTMHRLVFLFLQNNILELAHLVLYTQAYIKKVWIVNNENYIRQRTSVALDKRSCV